MYLKGMVVVLYATSAACRLALAKRCLIGPLQVKACGLLQTSRLCSSAVGWSLSQQAQPSAGSSCAWQTMAGLWWRSPLSMAHWMPGSALSAQRQACQARHRSPTVCSFLPIAA